jgi:DNA-binding NtrC family response regulator
MGLSVLVIDDEPSVTSMLARFLAESGHVATALNDPSKIPAALAQREWDLILCDMYLGSTTGVEVLKEAVRLRPGVPFVVMTAHGTLDLAMDSIRGGAFDFMGKPIDFRQLKTLLQRVQERGREVREVATDKLDAGGPLLGRSPAMVEVYKWIVRVAPLDIPALIRGESGTGKELIARALHDRSPRAKRPFVPVNCAAIPENLLESELFGHIRGAFTGAVADKPGLIREASGGSLFLDEIGELPTAMQSKLLRVLEDRQVRPVGSEKLHQVDVRLISATNRPLERMVKDQSYREDLFYRINGSSIRVPPLRERLEDLEIMAAQCVFRLSQKMGREIVLTEEGCERLKRYLWPGNVRELLHEIERAAAVSATGVLTALDFDTLREPTPAQPVEMRSLEEIEKEHILSVLRQAGSKQKAAEILKIDRKTLHRKLRQYGAEEAGSEP